MSAPEHCWHSSGGLGTSWHGGPSGHGGNSVQCCHCGRRETQRYYTKYESEQGHGPYHQTLRVIAEPVLCGESCVGRSAS